MTWFMGTWRSVILFRFILTNITGVLRSPLIFLGDSKEQETFSQGQRATAPKRILVLLTAPFSDPPLYVQRLGHDRVVRPPCPEKIEESRRDRDRACVFP